MQSEKLMLSTMLKYQIDLNDVFDPNWRKETRNYMRCSGVESAELIDHHGYKWWKKQTKNIGQMQLEVVDIIHFYLSQFARNWLVFESAEEQLHLAWAIKDRSIVFDGKTYHLDELDYLEKIDLMMGSSVSKRINFELYRDVMRGSEMSFNSLYRLYAGKNVLNLFRQHNGDKKGTYTKIWSNKEDNEYLTELMATWKEDEGMDVLYARLEQAYKANT